MVAGSSDDGTVGVTQLGAAPRLVTWGSVRVAVLASAVAGVPLGVALVALREPRWYPAMDYALTELLVRDVGSSRTPLVGMMGRFYSWGERGSHPGPLAFWLLAPLYTLFGRTAWALTAATATLNLAAVAASVWIGQRRGGRLGAVGVAATLVVLVYTYRPVTFVQPWNPYIPLLWWVVFLLAAWSVLCRDVALLPLAGFAATVCMQSHVSYVGLVGGVAAMVAVATAVWAWRAESEDRRQLARRALPTLVLVGVLWLPPVIQQLTDRPGNLAILWASLTDPDTRPVGASWQAVETWLAYLDPRTLLHARDIEAVEAASGSPLPGLALLAAWGWAVVETRRAGHGPLVRLHLVVGTALALGLVSITRIHGGLAHWVVMWAWGTTAMTVMAVAATAVNAWLTVGPAARPARLRTATALTTAVLVFGTVRVTVLATGTEPDVPDASPLLADLAPAAVASLVDGHAPGTGEDERYLLRWESLGGLRDAAPYGLLLELERRGLDVGAQIRRGPTEIPYRWRDPDDATAFVHYVVGENDIARQRRRPDMVEIAHTGHEGRHHPATSIFVTPAP